MVYEFDRNGLGHGGDFGPLDHETYRNLSFTSQFSTRLYELMNEELNDLRSRVDELEINTRDELENLSQDLEIKNLEVTKILYIKDSSELEEEDYMRCPLTEMEKENRS